MSAVSFNNFSNNPYSSQNTNASQGQGPDREALVNLLSLKYNTSADTVRTMLQNKFENSGSIFSQNTNSTTGTDTSSSSSSLSNLFNSISSPTELFDMFKPESTNSTSSTQNQQHNPDDTLMQYMMDNDLDPNNEEDVAQAKEELRAQFGDPQQMDTFA